MRQLFTALILLCLITTGCATRQVIPDFNGSTAQRLVTHSIDKLMKRIPEEDFAIYRDKKIYVEPHFITKTRLYNYATKRFKMELAQRFSCQVMEEKENSEFVVDLFFTSLGTEHDAFGFTFPLKVVPGYQEATDIKLLALEMFHGISEMYYYLSDKEGKVLLLSKKSKASVRTDTLALPLFTMPINTLDR